MQCNAIQYNTITTFVSILIGMQFISYYLHFISLQIAT